MPPGSRAARLPGKPVEDISNSGTKTQKAKAAESTTQVCNTSFLGGLFGGGGGGEVCGS